MNCIMTHIICGSKPYYKINFSNIIDNNFKYIYRCNMLLMGNIYGKRDSTFQIINCHMHDKIKRKKSLNDWYLAYKLINNDKLIEHFVNWVNQKQSKVKYLNDNNTSNVNKLLSRINSTLRLKKQARVGLGGIAYIIEQGIKPFVIGFSLDSIELTIGWENSAPQHHRSSLCHDVYKEKEILRELHKHKLVDATLCALEDFPLPLINCKYLSPTKEAIHILLKACGICVLKNYFSEENEEKFINEFQDVFKNHTNKMQVINDEGLVGDPRIHNVERYSEYIRNNFSNSDFFNTIAKNYTKSNLSNKKTLINKVIYKPNEITNSGGGWHRDNHQIQFKTIMYLTDVTKKKWLFSMDNQFTSQAYWLS